MYDICIYSTKKGMLGKTVQRKEWSVVKEVLILEDKEEARKLLVQLVKEVRPDAVIYEASDEKMAYAIAMEKAVDLFLVDLILHPEQRCDVSGGDFAQTIRTVEKYLFTPIIIITSMYDPKMFMYSSVHCYRFIEKPFDPEKVKQIIGEAIRYRTEKKKDRVAIFCADGMLEMVVVGDIIFIESIDHKLNITTTSEKLQVSYKTCSKMLEELDCDDMVQCKRGVIVNLEHVRKVDPVNRYVYLRGSEAVLEIGPIMKKEFMRKVMAKGIPII